MLETQLQSAIDPNGFVKTVVAHLFVAVGMPDAGDDAGLFPKR